MPPVTPSRILRGCGLMAGLWGGPASASNEALYRGIPSSNGAMCGHNRAWPTRGQWMSIRQWPQRERPREKLLERGPSILTEAELLAILLRTGVRGHSALDVARQLLIEFGSLRGLLTAEAQRLCATRGLGPAR